SIAMNNIVTPISLICIFFISSRRRHTRCYRDWSSDVCSSDLRSNSPWGEFDLRDGKAVFKPQTAGKPEALSFYLIGFEEPAQVRSEERRVGKECKSGWAKVR